jgi:colicin import membrane protein
MRMNKKVLGASLGALFAVAYAAQPATAGTSTSSVHQTKHTHTGNRAQFEAKLAKEAQAKGITVDALKAQLKTQHKAAFEAKLAKEATAEGITVDQLKANLKAKGEAKLEQLAKQKGLTVDQLKAQWKAKHDANMAQTPQS